MNAAAHADYRETGWRDATEYRCPCGSAAYRADGNGEPICDDCLIEAMVHGAERRDFGVLEGAAEPDMSWREIEMAVELAKRMELVYA